MKAGVLGGTFDPVHLAHLALAEHAREQLGLDKVLWVPAGDPWRKSSRRVSAAAHRVAMVRLAIEGNPAFELRTLEVERERPSYTVETVAALEAEEAGLELVLLLGQDALFDLPSWREPRRLLELARLAVARRGGEPPALDELERQLPGVVERLVWLEMPRLDISSTELRRWAAEGRSLRYLVPDMVVAYVREHGLYVP